MLVKPRLVGNAFVWFAAGVVAAILAVVVWNYLDASSSQDLPKVPTSTGDQAPALDLQKDPIGGADRISESEARARTSYRVPIPKQDEKSGALTGIWMDANQQVAYVWEKDVVLYVIDTDLSEDEYLESWTEKVAAEENSDLVMVRGKMGLATENPSDTSLVFVENGLLIDFVSPLHTTDELIDLAEGLSYEGI
jgi:hypothetical protein